MRPYTPKHLPTGRSTPLMATALLGMAAGMAALIVNVPSARLTIGFLFLGSFWVLSFSACRRLMPKHVDLTAGLLLGLGVGTGLAVFTLLVLAALGRLTTDTALIVLLAVLALLGWFGYPTGSLQRANTTQSVAHLALPSCIAATALVFIAATLAVLSVAMSVRSFRNDQRPLAAFFMAPAASGYAEVISVQDLSGTSEVAHLSVQADGTNLGSTTLRLRAGQTLDHVATFAAKNAHLVATVVVTDRTQSHTYTLAGAV